MATATTPGKYRHLSRCSTPGNHFLVLAIDHRANLREALDAAAAAPITDADFTAFKAQVLRALMPFASAVLTDPDHGIGPGIAGGFIDGRHGLLAPVEVTDYGIHPSQRDIVYIPGWAVAQIKRVGGDGVKLLLPYHPDGPRAPDHRAAAAEIINACAAHDIPFFLEPIPYPLDPKGRLDNAELRRVSIANARLFSEMGADVLKLPFPVDASQSTDEGEWRDACAELTTACGAVPWALLSAGVDFETFARQAEIACAAGASGIIAGRAIWAEAVRLSGAARADFLATTAAARMERLAAICAAATPWTARIAPPALEPGWYMQGSAG